MNKLNLKNIDTIKKLAVTEGVEELSLSSNALRFFTDFKEVTPLVIESNLSAVEARQLMKKSHVRLKLVIDENNELVGIVSAEDLLERKIIQKLQKGDKREDLSIKDFMIKKDTLNVLEYSALTNSNIKQVIEILKTSGQQHCLVVDSNENVVRGLFSVSDISRKLKVYIDIQDQPSFLKLASTLN